MKKMIDYQEDLYAWALHNAKLLRQGRWSEADIEHIIEELENMGKSHKRELTSRFKILLAHLLKWQYQPNYRGRSWQRSIDEQRVQIDDLLIDNPSLKSQLSDVIAAAYSDAVKLAVKETQMSKICFPQGCLYTIEQILDEDFYPE